MRRRSGSTLFPRIGQRLGDREATVSDDRVDVLQTEDSEHEFLLGSEDILASVDVHETIFIGTLLYERYVWPEQDSFVFEPFGSVVLMDAWCVLDGGAV